MTGSLHPAWRIHAARLGATTVSTDAAVPQGRSACDASSLITYDITTMRRVDGRSPSAETLAVAAVVQQAAEADIAQVRARRDHGRSGGTSGNFPEAIDLRGGRGDVPDLGDETPSDTSTSITVDTAEAARLLGLSPRQTRRYAGEVGASRGPRRRRAWPRAGVVAVAAHLADRRAPLTEEHPWPRPPTTSASGARPRHRARPPPR